MPSRTQTPEKGIGPEPSIAPGGGQKMKEGTWPTSCRSGGHRRGDRTPSKRFPPGVNEKKSSGGGAKKNGPRPVGTGIVGQ